MKNARITFVPFFPKLGEVESNITAIVSQIKEIQKKNNPDIIIFPELSTSGYLLENLAMSSAIDLDKGLPDELLQISSSVDIILGALIKENGKIFNAGLVLKDGKIHHIHRKIYLPTYGLFDEKRYFSSGRNLLSFESRLGKSALLVCEDAFHPALPYSLYAHGVKHVFIISCSPARGVSNEGSDIASSQKWKRRLEVYSESFGQFYYYVNRSGSEDGVYFDGISIFVSPNRETCESFSENPVDVEVHLSDLDSAFSHGGPFQYENWDLNRRILDLAHKEHE
ncbi:MAG: nitrilase-related carbon-nitrogen hydrolase [Leptospirales bacterium]